MHQTHILTVVLLTSGMGAMSFVPPASAQEPTAEATTAATPPTVLTAPIAPAEPTCKKKLPKQVMTGGQLTSVMMDNKTCLASWEAYGKARAAYAEALPAYVRAQATAQAWRSPTLGTMMWISPGTFIMGSPTDEAHRERDETQHEVTLTKGYWIMEHEVTQGQWDALMDPKPRGFPACGPDCPMEFVSWFAAEEYARRASARDGVTYALPTEAQWEYAARGMQPFVYAGSNDLESVAWVRLNSQDRTHDVCQKSRNGFGLCDMSGNVAEWTSESWLDYQQTAETDPYRPFDTHGWQVGVTRGGAYAEIMNRGWGFHDFIEPRVAYRMQLGRTRELNAVGFRLVGVGP